jgi:hypothetical protein
MHRILTDRRDRFSGMGRAGERNVSGGGLELCGGIHGRRRRRKAERRKHEGSTRTETSPNKQHVLIR